MACYVGINEGAVAVMKLQWQRRSCNGSKEATSSRKRPAVDPELGKRDTDGVLRGDRYFEVQEDLKRGRRAINNMLRMNLLQQEVALSTNSP